MKEEFTSRGFRVYAQIVYKNPKQDAAGFPDNEPIYNPDPTIEIHNDEMEELVLTVRAQTEEEVRNRVNLLKKVNFHIEDILMDCPGCSITEL
jgi:hypothetical protein